MPELVAHSNSLQQSFGCALDHLVGCEALLAHQFDHKQPLFSWFLREKEKAAVTAYNRYYTIVVTVPSTYLAAKINATHLIRAYPECWSLDRVTV
jgi:hypothetical protein